MIKILHNNRCSKSRCTLDILNEKGVEYEIVNYLENPPTELELAEIIKLLGIKAEGLVRKGESVFKEHYKGKILSEKDWIKAMVKFPKLIERPIVINGDKAIIGRPPEGVLTIL